ncbi:MAG: DMT family transporter [Pseudomonadota bacterium]
MTQALRAHIAMVIFAAVISVSFTLGDIAAPHIEPSVLTALRFFTAALLLGVLAIPHFAKTNLSSSWRYALVGGLIAGYFILMFEALRLTDPVSTSAVFTLTPIMSAFFGYLLMRQITTAIMAVALSIAGVGAIWVIFRANIEAILGLRFGRGEQLFFIGCAMHALYTPVSRLLNRGESVVVFSFLSICGGLLVTLLYGWSHIQSTQWETLPTVVWAAVLYLGIFATAATVFLMQFATLRLPAGKVMAYGYLVPVFVILWEGLIGHGWIQWKVLPGVIAIVLALLVLIAERERADSHPGNMVHE